jgi:nucleoside permease NupC
MTHAMCGFANFGSLGIMIRGLATMAPARCAEIVGLGFKSIVSGTLVACLLGALVGTFINSGSNVGYPTGLSEPPSPGPRNC